MPSLEGLKGRLLSKSSNGLRVSGCYPMLAKKMLTYKFRFIAANFAVK